MSEKLITVLASLRPDVLWEVGLLREGENNRKIDFLMLMNGSIEPQGEKVLEALTSIPDFSGWIHDDSVRFDLENISGGVAVLDTYLLMQKLESWTQSGTQLNGERRPWATGYWIPEALCGDLSTAKFILGKSDLHLEITSMVASYPRILSESICNLCKEEVEIKLNIFLHPDFPNGIEERFIQSDVASALIRFAFARSKIYLRGFRNINQQAKFLENRDHQLVMMANKLFATTESHELQKLIGEIKTNLQQGYP